MAKIEINNLTYYYPESKEPALKSINLAIEPGEFVVLVGPSGSGKSTLLRAIANLVPGFYQGISEGQVFIDEMQIDKLDRQELARKVAFLFQEPEHQIVKTRVENEIAFSLENLGIDKKVMKRRVAEVSSALDLVPMLEMNVQELSGGTKQKVVLASVLAVQPGILLLDEPISQLDPIAAQDLLNVIRIINEELGITVIITEHRLENLLGWSNRVIAMESGNVLYDGQPEGYCRWSQANHYDLLPDVPRLFAQANFLNIPLNIKQAHKVIKDLDFVKEEVEGDTGSQTDKLIITLKNLSYKYTQDSVGINKVNLSFYSQECTAIIGHNGAGKSTLVKIVTGILKPDQGQLLTEGGEISIGYVPQNPDEFLYLPTVEEEVTYNIKDKNDLTQVDRILELLGLSHYRHKSPRDLSFGEKQRVVIAAVLLQKPNIICLDEPTRGLDYVLKKQLGELLIEIKNSGTSIIIVSNDMEFIAEYSDKIVVMSKGQVIDHGSKYAILTEASFYAPQVNRLFKHINKNVLTYDQAAQLLQIQIP